MKDDELKVQRDKYIALYNFGEIEASKAQPRKVKEVMRNLLRDQEIWERIEPYVREHIITGSKSFDQARAAFLLMEADSDREGHLHKFGLNAKEVWDHMYSVLKQSGFLVRRGKVVGLLEYKSADGKVVDDDSPVEE